MAAQPKVFHKDMRPANRPIWMEALVGIDWLTLRMSPQFYGFGVPRGNGSAVVVIPGFMGTDLYLQEMRWWLKRIGYRPQVSGIGRNSECLDLLMGRLIKSIEKASAETGGPAHLIGHSLGGVLARAAATLRPDLVSSVITLGSPYRGVRSHPAVMQMANLVRDRIKQSGVGRHECYTGYCQCQTVTSLQADFPESILQTAIFTRTDGIVDWQVCVNNDPETDFEVSGTHVGLAFNQSVYGLIARRLAEASAGKTTPETNPSPSGI